MTSNAGAAVRVVDLRSATPRAEPEVAVVASPAAELLRLIAVLLNTREDATYELGRERIDGIRARVPEELLADIRRLGVTQLDRGYLVLSLIAAELPEPAGVPELVDTLRRDPTLTWRTLLAHEVRGISDAPRDLADRIMIGDLEAAAQLRELVAAGGGPAAVRTLIGTDPDTHNQRIVGVVERFDAAVNRQLETEAMGPVRRDAAYRRSQLDSGIEPSQVVLDASGGHGSYEDPEVRRVVLLPSYWMRPWMIVGRRGDGLEVISTAVDDAFLASPSAPPPPSLTKLCKALSDEGRLKLLRRMSSGPVSLSEATAELGVAKATAHHHLSMLCGSGLVTVRGEGRSTRYALRGDPARITQDALAEYLPIRR